ncbi:MAG: hypothetical protein DRR06_11970 [Gammaproteobacteria bacterium]|nr:MAG: hypothetical protein DRR06_11970 [Gammaproteobacteria bacterium]RLA50496.1 MAG: hypothetical protein DRR42_12995 [Gammaproteobacteria bacterium]
MAEQHILSGIKVVDFTHFVAGPHCTRLLAQHGAEVIKVEPLTGDPARGLPFVKDKRSGCFIQHNIGKKNLCLDLGRSEAQRICHELIKNADVMVENFTPGAMQRLNMDWETLKEINPELIMCSISCLGQTGPLSRQPGFDYIGQAYSGIMGSIGDKDGYPSLTGMAFGDVSTGAHAYGAIVSALFHKLHGGGGQYLDISLLDCLFSYHAAHVQMYAASDGAVNPPRCGHHHALLCPLGLFECHGQYVVIVAIGAQWENLLKLIGREDMLTDPLFVDLLARGVNQQLIIDAIENWLASTTDIDDALEKLKQNHVPCAPVLSIPEVMEHPHMVGREIVQTIDDKLFGPVKIPASPFKYSLFPEPLNLQAGTLGEHNHQILSDHLGYSDEQIKQLEIDGISAVANA